MTNKLAVYLLIAILCALGWDAIFNDWGYFLYLARKFTDLIEWTAFWR